MNHPDETSAEIIARVAKLEKSLARRDLLEAAAAVVVLVFFVTFLLLVETPLVMMLGVVAIMLATVEIVAVLFWTRRRDPPPDQQAPLAQFCQTSLARIDRQIQLLRRVTWWYSAPLLLGCCLMMLGLMLAVPELPPLVFYGFLAAFYACFVAVALILRRGNNRAVDSNLVPLRDQLARTIAGMD